MWPTGYERHLEPLGLLVQLQSELAELRQLRCEVALRAQPRELSI